MDENKFKEGMSVKELSSFTKKHRIEVFFCLAFLLACFFSFVMFGTGWAIIATSIGGIIGVLLAAKVSHLFKKIFHFVFKQEQTTQIILGVLLLIIAIFIPPLYFLLLGLSGGKDLFHVAMEISAQYKK
jgi:hypothetical protein